MSLVDPTTKAGSVQKDTSNEFFLKIGASRVLTSSLIVFCRAFKEKTCCKIFQQSYSFNFTILPPIFHKVEFIKQKMQKNAAFQIP